MNTLDEILNDSIIIAAHPDDEVLWFSSILDKVDHIEICFLKSRSYPAVSEGRIKVISEYPLKNISCLSIDEAEVFNDKNWNNAEITKFGMDIRENGLFELKGIKYFRNYYEYIRNYYILRKKLKKTLASYRNVFTHNPWGEYGNEEHVQVYRVVNELKKELDFSLWVNNYSSNKSVKLMAYYLNRFGPEVMPLNTNKALGEKIKKLYIRNHCWTWFEQWCWVDNEAIIKDNSINVKKDIFGKTIPINFVNIKINLQDGLKKKRSIKIAFIKKFVKNLLSILNSKLKLFNL